MRNHSSLRYCISTIDYFYLQTLCNLIDVEQQIPRIVISFLTLTIDAASDTGIPIQIHTFLVFTQTLTTLDLEKNGIGSQGAHDLANALKINKVTSILLLLIFFLT
jgi:hypothetical protein